MYQYYCLKCNKVSPSSSPLNCCAHCESKDIFRGNSILYYLIKKQHFCDACNKQASFFINVNYNKGFVLQLCPECENKLDKEKILKLGKNKKQRIRENSFTYAENQELTRLQNFYYNTLHLFKEKPGTMFEFGNLLLLMIIRAFGKNWLLEDVQINEE